MPTIEQKQKQEKRHRNLIGSINFLKMKWIILDKKTDFHYKHESWNFYPTTGLFYNEKTQERWRGVKNFYLILKKTND